MVNKDDLIKSKYGNNIYKSWKSGKCVISDKQICEKLNYHIILITCKFNNTVFRKILYKIFGFRNLKVVKQKYIYTL